MVLKGDNNMPIIIPIRELKNTASISKFVEETNEPVFVTKNGYGSMVMMSLEVYEREISKKQKIDPVDLSFKDDIESNQKINEAHIINETKFSYGKKE